MRLHRMPFRSLLIAAMAMLEAPSLAVLALLATTAFASAPGLTRQQHGTASPRLSPPGRSNAAMTPPKRVRLARIPESAEIVYHQDNFIFVMDRDGRHITRITYEEPRRWEHVAVSPDRRFIAANEQLPNPSGDPGGRSRLWIFDLEAQTEARLLPRFMTAGNGGVDWDRSGFVYCAAKETDPAPNPRTPADFIANAAANDVYRVRVDGTAFDRLTETKDRGEADVSVSEDGSLVAFMALVINPPDDFSEVWIANTDGTNPRLVYVGGAPGVASVHDPESSPDNSRVIFSRVNSSVPPNFPEIPGANTAHDIFSVNVDGTALTRVTEPGPISIVPDWQDDLIVYLEISERHNYLGAAVVPPEGSGPRRIKPGANLPKWIPPAALGAVRSDGRTRKR